MKLDSTIIGALIIGASIIIGVFVYQYNTDYRVCLRESQERWEGTGRNPSHARNTALVSCRDIKR